MAQRAARASTSDETGFDPVLLAVLANRLEAIVRDMSNTLLRTGRSAVLNTSRDFSCSIVTAGNELLAAAQGLPIHVVGGQFLSEAMSTLHPVLADGDAFLHNDPYHGNTHHADHSILVPVFHEGIHVFTAIAKAHQADCGNSEPTTYAGYARDIYEEGALNFPCVKVQSGYQDCDDIIRMCLNRIRVPEQWFGDYLAGLGAARTGERRLKEMLERYGLEAIGQFISAWFDYSERRMTNAISRLPRGSFVGSGSHDPVDRMPDGIPLNVSVEIDPDAARIIVDLRDNIDCMPNGFNESRACSFAAAAAGIFNSLPEAVPHNSGSLRRINILLRENCVAGVPVHPASCSVATTDVADRLISIINSIFADIEDGLGLAEGAVGMSAGQAVIAGQDARNDGAPYVNQLFLSPLGGPASPTQDGWINFGVPVDGGLLYRDSIEVLERKYPIHVREVRLHQDSEGAGRTRGAPGCRVVYGPTELPMSSAYLTDGYDFPPKGGRGGGSPARHNVYKLDAAGRHVEVPRVGIVELQPGEWIVEEGGGGGGYGHPFERDLERVRADVEAGLVSAERARAVYGVSVRCDDLSRWVVDGEETERLRGEVTP